jgi:predicted nuclease of predicted toxin-antitoxin system
MKLLVDVSLSPAWVDALRRAGFDSVHWSEVGDVRAPDAQLLAWAKANDRWVFTHDLDFGAILAATGAKAPSVIQLRAQDVLPDRMLALVVQSIEEYREELESGALISLDDVAARARILPLLRP